MPAALQRRQGACPPPTRSLKQTELLLEQVFAACRPRLGQEDENMVGLCWEFTSSLPCSEHWWRVFREVKRRVQEEELSFPEYELMGPLVHNMTEAMAFPALSEERVEEIESLISRCNDLDRDPDIWNPDLVRCEQLWSVALVLPPPGEVKKSSIGHLARADPLLAPGLYLVIGDGVKYGQDCYKCIPMMTMLGETRSNKFELAFSRLTGGCKPKYVAARSRRLMWVEGSWAEGAPGSQSPVFTCDPIWVREGNYFGEVINGGGIRRVPKKHLGRANDCPPGRGVGAEEGAVPPPQRATTPRLSAVPSAGNAKKKPKHPTQVSKGSQTIPLAGSRKLTANARKVV